MIGNPLVEWLAIDQQYNKKLGKLLVNDWLMVSKLMRK